MSTVNLNILKVIGVVNKVDHLCSFNNGECIDDNGENKNDEIRAYLHEVIDERSWDDAIDDLQLSKGKTYTDISDEDLANKIASWKSIIKTAFPEETQRKGLAQLFGSGSAHFSSEYLTECSQRNELETKLKTYAEGQKLDENKIDDFVNFFDEVRLENSDIFKIGSTGSIVTSAVYFMTNDELGELYTQLRNQVKTAECSSG